jgi:hypothetical protein
MRRFATLITVATLAALLAACGSSKSNAGSSSATTSIPVSAEVTSPPGTGGGGTDAAAFANGIAWFFTDNSATTQATVPATISSCVQAKLKDDDAKVIAALKANADDDNLDDAVAIRVLRASAACDHGWVVTSFAGQIDLSKFGVTDPAKQACITTAAVDDIVALDDSKVSGTGGNSLAAPLAAALESCVPIAQGLAGLLADPSSGLTQAQATCIADAASKTVTWQSLLNQDPSVASAITTAKASCG